jgi:hypothetical protein
MWENIRGGMKVLALFLGIILLVGCDGDRAGGWDTNKYELVYFKTGLIYFATNYELECQDANEKLGERSNCRYNPQYKSGGMAVDNIQCRGSK